MRDSRWNTDILWGNQSGPRYFGDRVEKWELTPLELQEKLDQGSPVVLLDVREPWEADVARLEPSRLIPMGELEMRVEEELDREEEIIVYCHHGLRSMEAAQFLWNLGFFRVKNLTGGIDRWADQVDPDMPRY